VERAILRAGRGSPSFGNVPRSVQDAVARLARAGYKIVAPAKDYSYGTEAFVADPDGYVWALIKSK
jgi:hypothetical protein